MKQEVIPTSPKIRSTQKKENSNKKAGMGLAYLIVFLIFSFIGGVFASIIVANYPATWPLAETIRIPVYRNVKEIVTFKNQDNAGDANIFSSAINKVEPSIVNIYKTNGAEKDLIAQDYLGSALVVTADGWLVCLNKQIENLDKYSLLLVTSDNKKYQPQNIIVDDYTQIAYLQVNANNLNPAQFASADNISLGEEVLSVYNSASSSLMVKENILENVTYHPDFTFSTKQHPYNYLIGDMLNAEYLGSPVVNTSGDIVGLNLLENRVLPNKYFTDILPQVLAKKTTNRLKPEFEYYDLARQSNLLALTDVKSDQGVMIVSTEISNLLEDDIILEIDGQKIDQYNNLNDIIQTYKAGEMAKFKIIRQDKEQEVEVVF